MKKRIFGSYNKLKETNILSNFFNLSSIQISNILLLFITIRIITGSVGIEGFGMIMFAYRFSTLAGTVVNYGTGQSGVRDTAYHLTDARQLSIVFYKTLVIRAIIFAFFLMGMIGAYWFRLSYYSYILLTLPVVLAEIFNPLCFFIGAEKLKIFNVCNLIANVFAVIAILLFIKSPGDAPWINFILGISNVITYLSLLIYLSKRYKLSFTLPLKTDLLKIGRDNFYLTVNNISANLQQSVIIFALKGSNSNLLGAYTLCDRIMGQCRNLLNIIGNAVYPNAVNLYKQGVALWNAYRRKIKLILAAIFLSGSVLIFMGADLIVYILSKQHDANAITLLRIMALVPVVSASNVINILDLLIKNNTVYIFRLSAILLVISALLAFIVANTNNYLLIGAFTLIIEICAFLMSEYIIKKPAIQNA